MIGTKSFARRGGASIGFLFVLAALALPSPANAARTVVTPKAAELVKSSPVRVSVRAAWGVQSLRVRLNGVNLSPEFGRAPIGKRNVRTVRVSASHGLRYGANVLRVKKRRYGRRAVTQKVRFRLSRKRPLVGAGRDRRITVTHSYRRMKVGRSISLRGRASRPRDAPRARRLGSVAGLRMRWRLVRKPAGSKATLTPVGGVQPTDDELANSSGPQPARPHLKHVDKPGRYVAELVVRDRGVRSATDRVVTTAVIGTPLVPIDTAASVQGQDGIAIGYHPAEQGGRPPQGPNEQFFPLASGDQLQLVVLDRNTLETTATWSGPPSATGVTQLGDKLAGYEDNVLAIVTAWRSSEWFGGATDALVGYSGQGVTTIGAFAPPTDQIAVYGLEHGGQLSWIGAPGFSRGDAWEAGFGDGPPALRGFVSPDNDENYAYLATDPTTYEVGTETQSATGNQVVRLAVGELSALVDPLPNGEGGFAVAYYRGQSLEYADVSGAGPRSYVTRNADGSPNYGGMSQMTDDLTAAVASTTPVLFAVHSLGPAPLARMGLQPPHYEGQFDPVLAAAIDKLASAIGQAGGREQAIYGMSTQPTGDDAYALLGSNYAAHDGLDEEGSGVDAGSQIGPSGGTTVSGIVAKDKQGRYVPKASAAEPLGSALAELIVAEPSEWPDSSTPGQQAALKCIGNAQGLGPDPRTAYWLQTYSSDRWSGIQAAVSAMQPSACSDPAISTTDFTKVRDEIAKEIGWLVDVRSYLGSLSAPFTDDGLSSFADLQSITADVVQAVNPPQKSTAGIDPLAIFADVLDVLDVGEVPGAGAVAAGFFLAADLTTDSDNGPTIDWGDRVEAASANVGQKLAQQLQTISSGNQQLVDIIASDYEKLSTVGALGQCTPGAPNCTPEWQFTQEQQNAASRAYEISAKRQIWSGVLPAGYPFVLLTTSNPGDFGGDFQGPQEDIRGISCGEPKPGGPFDRAVVEPVFLRYGIREVANTKFMVFSQQNFSGGQPGPTMFPPASLLSPLFAPLDPGGDPNKGGLGLDRYGFMIDNWELPLSFSQDTYRVPWRGC
jgi:hypothetical protein